MRNLRDDPPGVVIGTGPIFANLVAAANVADHFDSILVLHYRDEWHVNTPPFVDVSTRSRSFEEKCLARANLVVFVTPGKLDAYLEAFPSLSRAKCRVIRNGWDPVAFAAARHGTSHLSNLREFFTLLFMGRDSWGCVPAFLKTLDAALRKNMEAAEHLRLCILGSQPDATEAAIGWFQKRRPSVAVAMSEVSKTTAIEILRESSATLLLNNLPYVGVVPLKTFDYIESGRPILVYGRTGEAAQIVEDLGAGLVVGEGDASALESALVNLMDSPAASWSSIARRLWSERNNRETVLGDLLRGIDSLVSSGRSGVEDPHRSA